VDELLRLSGEIDVYVITGEPGEPGESPVLVRPKGIRRPDYEIGLLYFILLGLSICRAIVAAHGGRIWALNRPGGGAAVRFTFPLEVQDADKLT
jgi:hypothetical protein